MRITANQLTELFIPGGLLHGATVRDVRLSDKTPGGAYAVAEIHMESRAAGNALLLLDTLGSDGFTVNFACTEVSGAGDAVGGQIVKKAQALTRAQAALAELDALSKIGGELTQEPQPEAGGVGDA